MRRTAAHFLRRIVPPPLCVAAAARIGNNAARVDAAIYQCLRFNGNTIPRALLAQPALATAKNYRDYADQLRGFSATLQEGDMKWNVDGVVLNIDHYCKGLKDDEELSNNALSVIDGFLRLLLPPYERFITSLNGGFNFWEKSGKPSFAGRVAFRRETSLKECERVVRVPAFVVTPVAKEVSEQLGSPFSKVVVVTGESGGGKTMGSIVGSVKEDKHFALYLGSIAWPSKNEKDNDTYDEQIANRLLNIVAALLDQNHKTVRTPPPTVPDNAVMSLIVDEMGASPAALKSLCRLSVVDDPGEDSSPKVSKWGRQMFAKLQKLVGVSSIRIVAAGTGCDDVTHQAGSHPDTYHIVRAGAADGNALWDSFCNSRKGFGALVLAATGGLAVCNDAVQKVPGGAATMESGVRLRGNARMAALMIMQVLGIPLDAIELDKQTDKPSPKKAAGGEAMNTAVVASQAVVVAKAIQGLCVRRFVGLNALRQYSSDQRMTMCAVAFGVAMSHSDSPLTQECFDHLCCTTGLLTSHAVVTQDRAVAGREVNKHDGDVPLGEGERLIVKDHGARYRISPAIAAMYLMEFGIAHRSTSGDDFERFVVDYLMVAVPAAAAAAHLGLSCGELPRNGLFDLLVAAFHKARCGMLASIGKCVLTERCAPLEKEETRVALKKVVPKPKASPSNKELKALKSDSVALEKAWSTATAKEGKQPQVLIVQHVPGAPAADIIVLCKGKFALHVQCKSLQQSQAMGVDEVKGEFKKMSSSMFPKQYRALVYCSADKSAAAALKAKMPPNCVFVSTYPTDPAFLPLSVPSGKETASEADLQVAVFEDMQTQLKMSKQAKQPST